MRRPDGRIVERVRLPAQLIDDVAREAKRRGQPFEDVAGDLVAEALPEALREAAEALLAAGRESLKRNAHGPTPLAASDDSFSRPSSTPVTAAPTPRVGIDADGTHT
jgi:hypothetical protein